MGDERIMKPLQGWEVKAKAASGYCCLYSVLHRVFPGECLEVGGSMLYLLSTDRHGPH